MAREAGKTLAEADTEVSEAVDFARYYARSARQLAWLDGATARPLGTVAVIGPWNFPLAIPIGGALAALAAGKRRRPQARTSDPGGRLRRRGGLPRCRHSG